MWASRVSGKSMGVCEQQKAYLVEAEDSIRLDDGRVLVDHSCLSGGRARRSKGDEKRASASARSRPNDPRATPWGGGQRVSRHSGHLASPQLCPLGHSSTLNHSIYCHITLLRSCPDPGAETLSIAPAPSQSRSLQWPPCNNPHHPPGLASNMSRYPLLKACRPGTKAGLFSRGC